MLIPILNVNDNKRPKEDNLISSYSWHCQLGHTSERYMTKLHKSGSLWSLDCDSFDKYESFLLGKDDQVNGPLDLIHIDVCGPICQGWFHVLHDLYQ